jgi:peroxiredoxin
MRKLLSLLTLTTCLLAAEVPRKAPEFVINMPDGKQVLLSTYRGKTVALAFMFTTCPHCQHTAQVLTQIQKEYAPKGVQMLAATFDEGAGFRVQRFNQQFGVGFPCGYAERGAVLEFLQQPPDKPFFVPILVFIDKKGTIRSQYIGDESFFQKQEENIRAELDKVLKGSATPATTTRSAAKTTPRS